MNVTVFAFTARGRATALRIRECLGGAALRAPSKFADGDFSAYEGSLSDAAGAAFHGDALIFVGACGIAVRAVAPHVRAKTEDPAVLCVDERGQFVIPILSGHIGGANRLAHRVARALGATPVITTATDVNGKFSVDAWAAEHDMFIASIPLAKAVSAGILTRDIPFWAEREPSGPLPDGLVWADSGELGICVSPRDLRPFEQTLLLVPRVLRVGIGCRRGTEKSAVAGAVAKVFVENHLRPEAVAAAASIDVKADEAGLLEYCEEMGWPIEFYSAAQLNAVPGDFTASAFVKSTVGVDNVCERAAMIRGGRRIVPKTAVCGVTVAVCEQEWRIDFGEDSRGGHRPGSL